MNDRLDPLRRLDQRRRVGHVTLHELAVDAFERGRTGRIPDERAHPAPARDELADGVPPHEAVGTGDEDHASKFFQYLLGVGPRCPWYFDPSVPEPYGVSAGSDIWTKESWPIFISG